MSENGRHPLSRWSARKTKARREEALTSEAKAVEQSVAPEAPAVPVESKENVPAAAGEPLPDIDSLDKDSDYTVFMGEGVPEHLKRLALRKLWLSDPAPSGNLAFRMSATVAITSVRHTNSSLTDSGFTRPGHRTTSGTRCPPSQI